MSTTIESFLRSCPTIKKGTKYWFIRTDGGRYLKSFIEKSIIGINYPEIKLIDLVKNLKTDKNQELLKDKIKKHYPDSNKQGLIFSQLLRFKNEMKNGDFVVAPGKSTHTLLIGRIVDANIAEDVISIKKHGEEEKIKLKTKKVEWIKSVPREKCNPNLFQTFYSHQTIVDIGDASEWVDILLYDFYKKFDEYHFVLNVQKTQDINIGDMHFIFNDILKMTEQIGLTLEYDINIDSIKSKTNLNSPGYTKFIDKSVKIGLVGLLVFTALGGKFDIDLSKGKMSLQTTTTLAEQIKILVETYDGHKNNSEFTKKLLDLNVKSPDTILKMMYYNKLIDKTKKPEEINNVINNSDLKKKDKKWN